MRIDPRGDCIYEIAREGGMRVPGRVIASPALMEDLRDDVTLEQVRNVAHLPGITGQILERLRRESPPHEVGERREGLPHGKPGQPRPGGRTASLGARVMHIPSATTVSQPRAQTSTWVIGSRYVKAQLSQSPFQHRRQG